MVASKLPPVILLHGWGTHASVWKLTQEHLADSAVALDFPGYGSLADQMFPDNLDALVSNMLERAPETAVWVGWSLGGMVALRAACLAPERVCGLMLLSSTPKFVASEDWPAGTRIEQFENFVEKLATDYDRSLRRFLLLQAGETKKSRELGRLIQEIIETQPQPSTASLTNGLSLLKNEDLRNLSEPLKMPVSVMSGQLDHICHPLASQWLAQKYSGSLQEIRAGHGPLLSHPGEVAAEINKLLERITQ